MEENKAKKIKLEEEIQESMHGKEESEERKNDLATYQNLLREKESVDKELKKFADFDPILVKKIGTLLIITFRVDILQRMMLK